MRARSLGLRRPRILPLLTLRYVSTACTGWPIRSKVSRTCGPVNRSLSTIRRHWCLGWTAKLRCTRAWRLEEGLWHLNLISSSEHVSCQAVLCSTKKRRADLGESWASLNDTRAIAELTVTLDLGMKRCLIADLQAGHLERQKVSSALELLLGAARKTHSTNRTTRSEPSTSLHHLLILRCARPVLLEELNGSPPIRLHRLDLARSQNLPVFQCQGEESTSMIIEPPSDLQQK